MASLTWTLGGGATGNWNTPADWFATTGPTGLVPVAGDSVFINRSGGNYTVTLDTLQPVTGSYTALTVGYSGATLALSVPGTTLSVSGLTTLSAGNIKLSSAATLSTDTFLVSGGAFTESQGLLSVTGSGPAAFSVTSGSFSLSEGIVAVTNGASFRGSTDTISGGAFNAGSLTLGITSGAAQILTLSGGTTTVSGLTTISGGSGGSKIAISAASLTATGGITFSGSANFGAIIGSGTVGGGLISGLGGTITAAGGTLDIGNAISSGLILTIGTTAASVLKLDGSVTSASAITITNANQTLEIGAAGALTIGVAENVTLVTIKLDGGTLNDVNIISFGSGTSNGTLSGFGMVAADLARVGTGINNKITAAGGTLDLAGKFGAGLVAVINAGSDLKFDNVAASNAAIGITLGTQTLEIGASGALTISAIESITNGTIKLDGGSLTDTSGLTIGSAANLIGAGIISTGAADFEGAGTVTAFAGVLDFTTAANLSGAATAYHIADAIGSDLRFVSTVGTGTLHPTITFDSSATGGLGTLDLTHTTLGSFHATVDQFVFGDAIDVLHADHLTLTGGTTLNVFNAANASLGSITLGESHAGANFFVNDSGAITTDQPCYAAGTRILTATGERMVESLMKGDIVLTLAGGELSAQPVKWIGQRRIDLTAHPRPETAVPICIRRGAFAENIPHRDLLLSPDHAVFVDGKLICARQLINGSTIRQETGRASVEYFHVELDVHAILLAEGLPAESYLNTGNRGFFANSGEPLVLHPDLTDESDYPTRAAGSCAPFVSDEASVRPVWQRLAERAAALGQPAPTPDTTSDPELCIVAKGRTARPLYGENGLYIFALPKGATEVRLVSRSGSPADARPWLDDRRRLGVNVERILLRGASELRELPVDHPGLSQGWQAVERDGTALRRWTSGDAVLPLPALVGPAMLEIRAGNGGMTYLTSTDEERRAA